MKTLLLLACGLAAQAQETPRTLSAHVDSVLPKLEERVKSGKPRHRRENLATAGVVRFVENHVLAAERQDCSPETQLRSLQAAHAHFNRAEYTQAERVFRAALGCQRQSLPANHPVIGVTLANLGELERLQLRFKEAERLLTEAQSIQEAGGRTESPAFGSVLLSLASVYKDRKQYHRAEPLARRALRVFENSSGPGSSEVTAALNMLAVLHAESGDLDGAERHLRMALASRQNSPDDVSIATAQHNMGMILSQKGNLAEAGEWLLRALDLRSRLLGSHHPVTGLTLGEYEHLLKRTGRKAEARQIRARARQSTGWADR